MNAETQQTMSKPLRILHVIPQFPYFGGRTIVGGHASCLLTLSLAQAKAGHDVTIVSCAPKGSAQIDDRLKLHSLFKLQKAGTVKFGLQFRKAVLPWAKAHKDEFDVVHCHSGFADYFVVSSALKRTLKIPTLHTLYCPIPQIGGRWRKPIVKGILTRCAKKLDSLAAMSGNVAKSMEEYGLPDVKITAPPVDIKRFCPPEQSEVDAYRTEIGIAPGEIAVLFVGNAKPQKNMIGVLRAFRRVKDQYPKARLIVTTELSQSSSDEHLALLRRTMDNLNLSEDLIQMGIIDNMPRLMQSCDLLVAPFLDSFGPSDYFMVVLETMACGKPTIASAVGGMPEVLDNDRGRLIDPTSEDELVEAMSNFIGNSDLRKAAGDNARFYTEQHFDPAQVAASHIHLYAQRGS